MQNIVPTSIIVLSHLKMTPGDTANETVTVHFATRVEDSAFGTRKGRGRVTTTTRTSLDTQGAEVDADADLEKGCSVAVTPTMTSASAVTEDERVPPWRITGTQSRMKVSEVR